MSESADVVVVGGGIAGLMSANRAAQAGLSAVVLERGTDAKYLCNSRYTGGAIHVAYRDVSVAPDVLRAAIDKVTEGYADPALAEAVSQDVMRAVRWLQAEGVRLIKGPEEYQSWLLAPPRSMSPGLNWEWRSGDTALRTLEPALAARGGRVVRGATAEALAMEGGRCVGVDATVGGEKRRFSARAVVLADGGFQGAPDLLRGNVTPAPEKIVQRGAGTGIGSGLRMARAVGGAATDLTAIYGHLLSRDALANGRLWPWPILDNLATVSLLVGADGRRFTDEARGGVHMTNAVMRLADPLSTTVVFDHAIWEGPGREKFIPANPHLDRCGATIHRADDLATLARLAGLPADALADTIARYNAAIEGGALGSLEPPRGAGARPIRVAPFYAVPACAGITQTMGGIAIDGDARVVSEDGGAIPGLWAAGGTTGGLEGGPACGYVGGLARSAVTALRAAESIARALGRMN